MAKMTKEERTEFKEFIDEAHYALVKQIKSSLPMGNYGTIELLDNEKPKYDVFLIKLLEKRIKNLSKILEEDKKWHGK